jgi:hypothetical protein
MKHLTKEEKRSLAPVAIAFVICSVSLFLFLFVLGPAGYLDSFLGVAR